MTTQNIANPKFSGKVTSDQVVRAIDHTKLTFKPGEVEEDAIRKLCAEAKTNGFFAVCVRPRHIALAKSELSGSDVKVATVIGFPQEKVELQAENQAPTVGNYATTDKLAEVQAALANGVDELDLVLNVGKFKAEASAASQPETLSELKAIQQAANGKPVKVIIEIDLLTNEEIAQATRLCHEAGVFMVKTSTGMVGGGKGATVEAVSLIRKTLDDLGSSLEIKASGGIKTEADARNMLEAGATRLGTSSGVEIKQGLASTHDY